MNYAVYVRIGTSGVKNIIAMFETKEFAEMFASRYNSDYEMPGIAYVDYKI